MRHKRALIGMLLPGVVATLLVWQTRPRTTYATVLTENGAKLHLQVADHSITRARGLADTSQIPADGLLLVWSEPGVRPIWMRNMRMSLDVIWCSSTGRILAINQDLPPCRPVGDCPLHGAQLAGVKYVLELPAHAAASANLTVGEHLVFIR